MTNEKMLKYIYHSLNSTETVIYTIRRKNCIGPSDGQYLQYMKEVGISTQEAYPMWAKTTIECNQWFNLTWLNLVLG